MDFKTQFHFQKEEAEEEDVFYAEIRKQILLLTADDDEEIEEFPDPKSHNSITAAEQGVEGQEESNRQPVALQPQRNLSWWGNENDFERPVWHVNPWKSGNGTGVFIPQAVKYTRYCISRGMKRNGRKGKR